MKHAALSLALCGLACGTSPADVGAEQAEQKIALAPNVDLEILQKAVSGLALQIAMADLAPTHGAAASVGEFAKYVDDLSAHGQIKLAQTAQAHGGEVSLHLRPADVTRVGLLGGLYAAAFDERYLQEQICRLEAATDEATEAQQQAVHPEIAAFASRSVDEIQSLLARARGVAKRANIRIQGCSPLRGEQR